MFWLGLLVGIFSYVVLVCILTFYNYRKQKKNHQHNIKKSENE